MDIFVATSRGRPLKSYLESRPNTICKAKGGASIEVLTDTAVSILENLPQNSQRHLVYYIAGLCDLTRKDKDSDTNYEEVTFPDNIESADSRMERIFLSATDIITQFNAIPIFCTIAPMDISTWNHHRLENHRTSYLLHHREYSNMQENLNSATVFINHQIISLNDTHALETPKLAQEIIFKPGLRRPTYRLKHSNLQTDGCHVTEDVNCTWRMALDITATRNRQYLNYH